MILRSGNAASFLVEFPSGQPDGNITWNLLGDSGSISTGVVTPAAGAVSAFIQIDALDNTLDPVDLSGHRDLTWSYNVGGKIINGEQRYTLEQRLPWGVSYDGVRNKLGVKSHELRDDEISLVRALTDFAAMTTFTPDEIVIGGYTYSEEIRMRDAIEAAAALALIPTMQVRVALKESSGTDTFQRDKIDWASVAAGLEGLIATGITVLIPAFEPTAGFGAIFILASPEADPFTGA